MSETSENDISFSPLKAVEVTHAHGINFVKDHNGIWHYADTSIPVPGARDVTLTERFRPKVVLNSDNEVERYIVSGDDVLAEPDLLDWCISDGMPIWQNDRLVEVLVPAALWEERNPIPGELFSPEHDGTEAEQQVAAAEREYREAERNLEKAAAYRADVLRRHAPEMTRQEARQITGLSVGRIQQLIRSEQVDKHELEILQLFAPGPIKTFKRFRSMVKKLGLPDDEDLLTSLVADLKDRGYLEARGTAVGLTDAGADLLASVQVAEKRSGAEED